MTEKNFRMIKQIQREAVFEEIMIMTENFPDNSQIQQQNKSPNIINRNKYTPEHIMVNHQKQRDSNNQMLFDCLQRAPAGPTTTYLVAATECRIKFQSTEERTANNSVIQENKIKTFSTKIGLLSPTAPCCMRF